MVKEKRNCEMCCVVKSKCTAILNHLIPLVKACQLSVKFEAIFVSKQYDFPPIVSCQLSQNLKFRVYQLSVRLVCQLSVKNMDDCQ
jgi:hypothetical protein